mgnify:CR=1 FL=1
MTSLAGEAVDLLVVSVALERAVAIAYLVVGPDQTLVSGERENNFAEVSLRFAGECAPSQRGAKPLPALIVCPAPTAR